MVGDPETLLGDSTLLSVLHPRQVSQGAGFGGAAWVRWGSFSVYGVKLHLVCATNGVPPSCELTAANIADVRLAEELINEAKLAEGVARRLLVTWPTEQGTEGGFGRGRHPPEYRTIRAAAWAQAANRDLFFELKEGLWSRGDAGDHPGRAGHQDRGEDLRLHLRLVG